MRHTLSLCFLSIVFVGCATPWWHYARTVRPTFRAPADSSDVYWNRAEEFLARTSPIQIRTDSLIQTAEPTVYGVAAFAVIRRTIGLDSVEFRISARYAADPKLRSSTFTEEDLVRESAELVHYIRTTETRAAWEARHK